MSKVEINNVKNRFLPIPESVAKGLEPEAKITDFDIVKELGSGSFGNVYLVVHKKTKAQYAIKAIDKRNKTNLEEKPYFRREVEVMYKIHHPNVVKLYGHFEDNNYCYFIMEYISKGNIYQLIPTDKKKRISTQVVASIMKDVISAVYFLHNMKPPIIHRDIKPENVLLAEGLVAKLTDFGWSNYMQEDEKRTTVCGTPIYLAPEIIKEKGHDEKVDIWCIGVLLFELITGSVPFQGNDIETLKNNILNIKITWPKDINLDAKNLIIKILKSDPNARLTPPEMMAHPFFTKFYKDAQQFLIKPSENAQYRPFIVSKDNPKNWNPEITGSNSNENKNDSKDKHKDKDKEKSKHEHGSLKEKYDNLQEKYDKLKNDYNKLKNGGNESVEELKKTLHEKEERVAQLLGITEQSDGKESGESYLKMRGDELEKENILLIEKVRHYEEVIKNQNLENLDNKLTKLRNSIDSGDNQFESEIESLQSQLNSEAKKDLNEIIAQKDKEIEKCKEDEKLRREKEKKKYSVIAEKYDKALVKVEKENKELKAKLKELEAKKK